jgi:hypothetical protein
MSLFDKTQSMLVGCSYLLFVRVNVVQYGLQNKSSVDWLALYIFWTGKVKKVGIGTDFFDEILRVVEDSLAKDLFPSYFQSSYFTSYNKTMRIKVGLKVVVEENTV